MSSTRPPVDTKVTTKSDMFSYQFCCLSWILTFRWHDCKSQTIQINIENPWGTYSIIDLNHCGIVTPYGIIELGQYWLRFWHIFLGHYAITRTYVDLSSVRSCGTQLKATSLEMVNIFTLDISSNITHLGLSLSSHMSNTCMGSLCEY